MSKSLRLSEKWFNRALWLVAFMFAWFLPGLGKVVMHDLPRVEQTLSIENFVDHAKINPLREQISVLQQQRIKVNDRIEQANLMLLTRRNDYVAARRTFENSLATRDVTQLNSQDDALLRRTQALDQLEALERDAEKSVELLSNTQLDDNQSESKLLEQTRKLEDAAYRELDNENRKQATRVFLYHLAITLPLVIIAAWLFAKKRKTPYWPFV